MRAVIMAGGKGTRMLPHTESFPKCLLKIHGRSLLDYQLEALQHCGITEIIIVTGYLEEKIREHVKVPVIYVHNPDYQTTNSAYGLWLAREYLKDGFIYLNSDLLFHPDMLSALLVHSAENAIIIERNVRMDSDMKKAALQDGRVLRMDKKLPSSEADAEAIGPVKFGKAGAQKIADILGALSTEELGREWAYGVFSRFAEGATLAGIDNPGFFWAEIDDANDYIEANQRFPSNFFNERSDTSDSNQQTLQSKAGGPLDELDRLLNAHFKEDLISLPGIEQRIKEELSRRRSLFTDQILTLPERPLTASALYKTLRNRIEEGERELVKRFSPYSYASVEGLSTVTQELLKLCPKKDKAILRMKQKTAVSILESHPPATLLSIYNAKTVQEALAKEDALSLLSLTRVTEDNAWQSSYREIIEKLQADAFEMGEVEVMVIGEARFRSAAAQPMKPWRITHAKETGRIICFCPEQSSQFRTPWLLHALVLFHYFFETALHGSYYADQSKKNKYVGKEIMNTIHNAEDKLTFFYSNLYSENLFWEKALELFFRSFAIKPLLFFQKTSTMGGYFPSSGKEEMVVSLNLIDHLWNINLLGPHAVTDTFVYDPLHFLYHFRGAQWYDLLEEVTGTTLAPLIVSNLGVGDATLTKMLIARHPDAAQ